MLELIAIFFLGKTIKKKVQAKGLRATKYLLLMVFFWLSFEFLGMVLGIIIFGQGIEAYLLAIPGAAFGAYLSYNIAENAY